MGNSSYKKGSTKINRMLTIEQEHVLIKKAQEDITQFEPLYDRYYLPIFYYVSKRTENKDTAGEITSIVFLKALENIKKYRFQGLPFSSWLFRIAQNTLMDMYRQHKSVRIIDVSTQQLEAINMELDTGEKEEQLEAIRTLIPDLPAEEITLIELRYFEQLRFKEIAEILDITEQSARVKTHRLLVKIKGILNLNLKK
jgi:RNA polymerase sigma-70 factor (ECF subfamily)